MKRVAPEFIESLVADYNDNLHTYISKYAPNKTIVPITENVFIVSQGDDEYIRLTELNARALCSHKNGYIFFRNDIEITAHLLIHEFIHRISTNKVYFFKYVEGINYDILSNALNEVLTEKITSFITQDVENRNPYTYAFPILDVISKKYDFEIILKYYFANDLKSIKKLLNPNYKFITESINSVIELTKQENIKRAQDCIKKCIIVLMDS